MSADLTPLTVNLLPEARKALEASAAREGLTHTDVVNQALLAYEQHSADPDAAFRLKGGRS